MEGRAMVAAPLSTDELTARADLVVEARVTRRTGGKAVLRLERIIKGEPRFCRRRWLYWLGLGSVVMVACRPQPQTPSPGDWWNEDAFRFGRHIRAYMVWDEGADCYGPVWWNAIEVLC